MKLSLAWIFDHIDADVKKVAVEKLIHQFCVTTAEIESYQKITVDVSSLSLARVMRCTQERIEVHSFEWKKDLTLAHRPEVREGDLLLVARHGKEYVWARATDFGSDKDFLMPAVYATEQDLAGAWKKNIDQEDYLLEVDNIAITNRADLWCHRGFAREIAAILKVNLRPIELFLTPLAIKTAETEIHTTERPSIRVQLAAPAACQRFAGLYLTQSSYRQSPVTLATRLARVDAKPIDLLVDLTNYVMFDISQPLHVFDVDKFSSLEIVPRMAKKGETVVLLDGKKITLTQQDLVITDGTRPLALAGIMGGRDSAEGVTTKNIFVEAAWFDPVAIRLAASRHKVRTESSARFEKGLDPNQNVIALQRFYKLLTDFVPHKGQVPEIVSVGTFVRETTIDVSHVFLETRIGVSLKPEFVVEILTRLGFGLTVAHNNSLVYKITVPTFRFQITCAEDIVEEIARFFGLSAIVPQPLVKQVASTDISVLMQVREIKNHLAYAINMHEVSHYALFDEQFLRTIMWEPTHPVAIKNPVSEHFKHLVTTLIPHMLQAVAVNAPLVNAVRFFEWARVWQLLPTVPAAAHLGDDRSYVIGAGPCVRESKRVAGIFYQAKTALDFYQAKAQLDSLFYLLNMSVEWVKGEHENMPWFSGNQVANLMCEGVHIGTAGMIEPEFFSRVAPGHAFAFELDGDFLSAYKKPIKSFQAPTKFPRVWLDISMLVPPSTTVALVEKTIMAADDRITSVVLIDFFEKEEWKDKKSVTMRFVIEDVTKTLTKEEIDAVYSRVHKGLNTLGAIIR